MPRSSRRRAGGREGHRGRPIEPIDRDRPAIRQARASLAGVLAPFFQREAERVAAQIGGAMKTMKMAKADDDELDPADVQEILDQIDLGNWADLAPDLQDVLLRVADDGISAAFDQIAVTPDHGITEQVHEDAVDYAQSRAAELVGMRVDEHGTLVENPNAEWAITDATREMLRAAVTRALEEGLDTEALAQQLADDYAFSDARAETIARTEIARADVEGNMDAYRRSGVVSGKQWVLGSEHDDDDECDDAAALGVVDLDDDFGGLGDPPAHPNCFLPGTLVSAAGVTAHFCRWFEGEVITVRTERQEFTATPNHPVLTRRGWVAVGALQIGDHLIECTDPRAAVLRIDPHDHHIETSIEQIAGALGVAGRVSSIRVPTAAEDFHGDGVADGEVDVVRPARALEPWRETVPDEGALDGPLGDGLRPAALFAPSGAVDEFGEGPALAPNGIMGRGDSATALLGRKASIIDSVSAAAVADGEPVPLEQFPDRGTVTPESAAEVHRRLAGLVQPVEIREIRKREFAGHVYNLSTRDHWYIADAIIAHNCVCDVLPVLAGDEA